MDDVGTAEGVACPSCGSQPPAGAVFCGECGAALGGPSSRASSVVDAAASAARNAAWALVKPSEPEPEPEPEAAATHRSPADGTQSYAAPDAGAELGRFVDGDRELVVLEIRGAWARVGEHDEEIGWVDGRRLVPPATSGGGTVSGASSSPISISAGVVIGAIAAVGVIVGAAVEWTSGFSGNSFDIPLFPLFDTSSFDADPKVGYVLVACAVVGLVCCFVRNAVAAWLRFAAGALALVPIVAYIARVDDSYSGTSIDLTDVLGAGVYVAGISAIVLALSALIDPWLMSMRMPRIDPSDTDGVTM